MDREDKPASSTSEPQKKRELKSRWEGSHSPFGIIWQVAAETGWSMYYIKWKINYQTLLMKADVPRYIEDSKADETGKAGEESQRHRGTALEFFQSQLR